MRGSKGWTRVGLLLAAFLFLAGGAQAESFEGLVPGEMLADYELDSYYGKGVSTTNGGVDTIIDNQSPDQAGVDNQNESFLASISDDQGISILLQSSGDYVDMNVYVTIDVNINGVEVGAPMILTGVSGGIISPVFDATGLVGPTVGGIDNTAGTALLPAP